MGTVDRAAGQLSRQIAQALRDAVGRGALRPGDGLPSTRGLAETLAVGRGTVIEAYQQLIAEGFLESQEGAGTRVAVALAAPDPQARGLASERASTSAAPLPLVADTVAASPASPASPAKFGARADANLAADPSRPAPAAAFAKIAQEFRPLAPIPFAVSVPGKQTVPADIWRRLGNRVRAKGDGAPSGYADPLGAAPLREAIAHYVRKSRSVRCEASQVIVTSGTQQGLFLASQVLLDRIDQVWVENPAYRGVTAVLESTGHRETMIRVPVDSEGIDVEVGVKAAPHARAAFVTPSHQYPLGMPMSMARRNALLAWARTHRSWIVEDDYDSELRYQGSPFPSLQGLDPHRVVYLGTFSKILFPSLRLGYAIVPDDLVDAFCGARVLMDRQPPNADQYALAAFMADGHLERHIRRVRNVYADQRGRLIETLGALLPRDVAWFEPGDQGMHIVLWLANRMDDRAVVAHAARAGVAARAISPLYAPGTARPGLVLGFGGFSDEDMMSAARKLADVILDTNAAQR